MTSPESGSREPDRLSCVDGSRHRALEARAVERFAEALVRAVEGLGGTILVGMSSDASVEKFVNRATVLHLISALRSPADTGEHQEGDVGS